jgi:glycosyltransferase involved in cell wall biosynthesis
MDVHEIHRRPREELRRIVARGRFDAVLALGDPYAWPVPATLRLPASGPRTVVVPCMNAENTRALRRDPDRLREWRELLGRASVVVQSSEAGFDAHLLADLGVPGAYVPNAVERVRPEGSLRTLLGLDPGRPTILCVSNLYPSKNQAGLLEALAERPGTWQLVLVGHPAPDFPEEAERVERLVAADPRVRLVRGLPPELVAAALAEADLFVLPSLSDATPLVILEAMSHGVPWIATQHCGAVHDWAGGLVLDPDDLGDGIDHLLADPAARERLGAAGRAHWEACFTRATVARRYDALLRGAAVLEPLPGPAAAAAGTDVVRAAFYDASLPATAAALTA